MVDGCYPLPVSLVGPLVFTDLFLACSWVDF